MSAGRDSGKARRLAGALRALACFAFAPAIGAQAAAPDALPAAFLEKLERERERLIELRHDLHRHPEVSGQEERTARAVAEWLRRLELEVETGVGGHGVVGVLRGGKPGPVVAYRADMDAVPSDAPDPVEYRSEVPGVRHICGHDVHTAIGVALAEGLAAMRDEIPGTVVLVFQPAEETATGAEAMLADGVFADPRPHAIFAVHTAPLEVGALAIAPGQMMASRDRLRLTIERAPDPAATAGTLRERILKLSTLTPEQAAIPTSPDFVFIALAPEPAAEPGALVVAGAVMTASREASARTHAAIEAIVAELENTDTVIALGYEPRWIAGVDNDPALVERATAAVESALGAGSVMALEVVAPGFSEDFGSFQEQVPGAYFFLGVSNAEKGIVGMPHSPGYAADDEAIFVGARAMAAVLLDFLSSRPARG